MTNPDDPAFPNKDHMGDGPDGLTKREYFAAMAMQGAITLKLPEKDKDLMHPDIIAKACVMCLGCHEQRIKPHNPAMRTVEVL